MGHLAVAEGQYVFNRSDLAERANDMGEPAALVEGYLRFGTDLPKFLKGSFAVVVLSEDGQSGLLAVDRIAGRYPLCYRVHDKCLVFGTHGGAIQAHPLGKSEIDPQGIFNYLYFNVTPTPGSVRKDIRWLLPGTFLEFQDGSARTGTYWEPSFRDDGDARLEDMCEEFRSLVRESVRSAAADVEAGCFLSGGTDSSTVAGMLSEVASSPARTYSIGFDAEGFDEMEYARVAAERYQTEHHEYYLTPEDLLDAIPQVAKAYSDPFGNASTVPAYYCARLAREQGVRRMLGGDGGDELFAGNLRYSSQRVFEFYEWIPWRLREWVIEPVVFHVPAGDRILPVRKVRNYIRQARIPMPGRMERYNHLERAGIETVLEPDFLALVDPDEPGAQLEAIYRSAKAETMLNRMLALDLKITLADNDLPKVSRMCHLAETEVVFPFLSDDIVEFSLRLPARWKLRGLTLRWFFKYALRDFLPGAILRKRKHGFGLPFGVWMRQHDELRDLAYGNVLALKTRRIVRSEYIDDLLRLHSSSHATYYGVMIWVLMMLEQWFRAHEDSADSVDTRGS
jgi:asparagine synthase (glutamine-hydrolysing)